MATQELLVKPTAQGARPGPRVLRRGGEELRRPPGRPRPVLAPGAAASSSCRVRPRHAGLQLVLIGLLTFLVCVGFGLLAEVSSQSAPVPEATTVVQVRADETLWGLAQRVVPGSPAGEVVDRIMRLNHLDGDAVHPGQPLVVPDAGVTR
ncbi:hypothetical protein GCM10010174_81260 [Kutzneria viridogrisea]|uniref:LysM domain-containing protein n=2 Tax=Kutzneria TaxID=43356 RepID=W5WFN1_9PSEU|nr:LysM peptidoglycan-binding domain-containing protein [Kutzneria albida]AHI00014.1 hypothetical protein KALB_6654 [Kutzneria albida DSM 43870]MBA8925193.1 nucleoid-associated protein YgaU [Kutzneria viridogrisea]